MVSLRHVHGDILDAEVRGHVRKVPFVTETNRPTVESDHKRIRNSTNP